MLTGVHDDCRKNINAQLMTMTFSNNQSSHTPATRVDSATRTSQEVSARRITNRYKTNRKSSTESSPSSSSSSSSSSTSSFASRIRGMFINAIGDGVSGCRRVYRPTVWGWSRRTIGDKWRLSDIYREAIFHCFSSGCPYERGFDYSAEKSPIQSV